MHDPQRHRPEHSISAVLSGSVEYVPPSPVVIERYAHAVSRALRASSSGARTGDETEFAREFATFVGVIARIHAKHLNKEAVQ